MRFLLSLTCCAAAVLVAGCSVMPPSGSGTTGPQGDARPPRPEQRCNAAAAQWAVGKTNTESNVNEARKRSGAYMARVLRPGQPSTLDFNAERLNLGVDASGRIISARCG